MVPACRASCLLLEPRLDALHNTTITINSKYALHRSSVPGQVTSSNSFNVNSMALFSDATEEGREGTDLETVSEMGEATCSSVAVTLWF